MGCSVLKLRIPSASRHSIFLIFVHNLHEVSTQTILKSCLSVLSLSYNRLWAQQLSF